MKNKLIGALFVASMLVAVPVCAGEAPAVTEPESKSGMISSVLKSIISAPCELHGKYPWSTGIAWTAIVAAVTYKLTKADIERTKEKLEDLF